MASDFRIDFTGIGAAKAGTTWIAASLAQHPQVCIATSKETNYFLKRNILSDLPVKNRFYGSAHFAEGPAWYEDQYRLRRPGQICGEYSNAYLSSPETAELLYAHNPGVKLLCCLRNPVDAIMAAYYQLARVQPMPDTPEAAFERYPQFVRYYQYHANLQPFLRRFPRAQIHLIPFDALKRDNPGAFRGICRFLGVDDAFQPPQLNRQVNSRVVLRSTAIRNLRCKVSAVMGSSATMRNIRRVLFRSRIAWPVMWLFRLNERAGKAPPMKPETYARLAALFREDVERLQGELGWDLSAWLNPPASAQGGGR